MTDDLPRGGRDDILKHMSWAGITSISEGWMNWASRKSSWQIEIQWRDARFTPSKKQIFLTLHQINEGSLKRTIPPWRRKYKMRWKYQLYMQDYLGTIKAVDEMLAGFWTILEANDLLEHTHHVYTSDQGFLLSEARLVWQAGLCLRWILQNSLLMRGQAYQGERDPDALVQNRILLRHSWMRAGVKAPKDMQADRWARLGLTGNEKSGIGTPCIITITKSRRHMVNRHYAISHMIQVYPLLFCRDRWNWSTGSMIPLDEQLHDDPAYADIPWTAFRTGQDRNSTKTTQPSVRVTVIDWSKTAAEGKVYVRTKIKVVRRLSGVQK